MNLFAGIDIGSVSTSAVVVDENGNLVGGATVPTGTDPIAAGQSALNKAAGAINGKVVGKVATGYGRVSFPDAARKTEIACQARGVHAVFPNARTIIDIGGQDAKVIKVAADGQVVDFAMNDKCAAGTGRFLEVMARALQVELDALGRIANSADVEESISSTCTVFAESEVIGLIAQKKAIAAVARGIHRSVCKRFAALARRVGVEPPVVLTGGVAYNIAVVDMLKKELNLSELLVPEQPQLTCAFGAALFARDKFG